MNRLALVRSGVVPEIVTTFVRLDTTADPPQGFCFVPEDSLCAGWSMEGDQERDIPDSIEAWKLREWLIRNGYSIANIDIAIASIENQTERELTENQWCYNTSYTRRHPMFAAFVLATGLSSLQIDSAFREASQYG